MGSLEMYAGLALSALGSVGSLEAVRTYAPVNPPVAPPLNLIMTTAGVFGALAFGLAGIYCLYKLKNRKNRHA